MTPSPDPESILSGVPVYNWVKADAWDAFHAAADPADFKAKFDPLPLPHSAKADLWDLKFGQQKEPATSAQPQPSTPEAPSAAIAPPAAIQQPVAAPVAQGGPIPQAAIPPQPISPQGAANAMHTAKLERDAGALAG